MCATCYRHQRYVENPEYAAKRRAQEREAARRRRIEDQEWAEKQRARDRGRTRSYTGNCELCGAEGIVAKGLCRRCYGRTWMQARRASSPELGKAETARNAKRIRENSLAVLDAKSRPCADCGGVFPRECMDLDHVRGSKLFSLSNAGSRTLASVLAEIAKCDAVCANCHRIRTRARAAARGRPGMC